MQIKQIIKSYTKPLLVISVKGIAKIFNMKVVDYFVETYLSNMEYYDILVNNAWSIVRLVIYYYCLKCRIYQILSHSTH